MCHYREAARIRPIAIDTTPLIKMNISRNTPETRVTIIPIQHLLKAQAARHRFLVSVADGLHCISSPVTVYP